MTNSQDVEDLLVTGLESKGVGTFRIHAITSNKTIASYLNEQFLKEKTEAINYFYKYNQGKKALLDQCLEQTWEQISNLTVSKTNWKQLKELVAQFKEDFKHWQKQYDNILIQQFVKQYNTLLPQTKNGINVLTHQFTAKVDINALKVLIDDYKVRYQNLLIFFVDVSDEKQATLIVGVSDDLHDRYQAGKIIQQLNPLLGGKGGGNNSVAQSGFNNKDKTLLVKLFADPLEFLKHHG
ncbi:MAG: hypothetical protein SPLM_05200 [Spiroplasma phoeniceum]